MIYNIFISHSWSYSSQYQKLINLLKKDYSFQYKNYSVPQNDPIHNAKNQVSLKKAIQKQMKPASCIIILAGVYATYSKWINIEVNLAKSMNKRIIAVRYRGAKKISKVVKDNADIIVGWNSNSIIKAVKGDK